MNPLVSVVIPAYNAAETIIPCIQSVLNQTYKNIEIVVINDGSQDQTKSVIEQFKKDFCIDNLRIVHQDNAGPSAARNWGIELAKGEYIAFLDSDDLWKETKIEKQMACFNDINVALVGCRFQIGEKMKGRYTLKPMNISFKQLLYRNYFTTPSVICKTEVLKNVRFDEAKKYSEDYYVWLMIAFKYSCVMLDECLVKLCDKPVFGSSGLSANLWKMEKGELNNYKHLYSLCYISNVRFRFYSILSLLKYMRRCVCAMFS